MKKKTLVVIGFVSFSLFFLGINVFGATISVIPQTEIGAKDVVLLDVFIDTEGELINSVDGSLVFSDKETDFKILDIILAQSDLTLWPRTPSVLEKEKKVSFVGGVPGGVKGSQIKLFSLVISFEKQGEVVVMPTDFFAYLNDGVATKRLVVKDQSKVTISKQSDAPINAFVDLISKDNTPPESFSIELITESDLYNGKKFLSFNTFDMQSGVSYFEVQEGEYPPVRTGNTYVLIDQMKDNTVIVKAYDKAGNFQKEIFVSKNKINWFSVIIGSILLVFIKFIIAFKKRV